MSELSLPAEGNRWRPWRVWVPLLLLPFMLVARALPQLLPNPPSYIWMVSAFGPMLVSLLIVLWLCAASRARWWERLLGVLGIVLILVGTLVLGHPSFRGPLFMVMTVPLVVAGFALGAIAFGRTLSRRRLGNALALALLCSIVPMLLKTDGVWGNFNFGLAWRWQPTAEDRFLAQRSATSAEATPAIAPADAEAFQHPDWPNLRGPHFDSAQHGVRFSDDWANHPPREVWRAPVGPAWSSFAVAGNYLLTQEQRGDDECVVCYHADSGHEVWAHAESGRFFESLGGLGPRCTPTVHQGFVYALGAEGKLLKLDATNGNVVWTASLTELENIKPPMWGFSSSPLVYDNHVLVYAGNEQQPAGKLLALKLEDGAVAWSAAAGKMSYASVQPLTIHNTTYLALLSELGLHLYKPDTGDVALVYEWKHNGYRALQPQVIDGDKILIPTGLGTGTRLVQATQHNDKLELEPLWTSLEMKPDFNDILVHRGYIYGFDNNIFACINLATGKREWKGGRYEKGQALLLADSDLIIVVSERGELVLLRTTPEKLQELAKIPAMQGKTWNHPVVVGQRLYLRNAEEAVCYELPVAATADAESSASATPAQPWE